MKKQYLISKVRYFCILFMITSVVVNSIAMPKNVSAKTYTKKELQQEVKRLTAKIQENNKKINAQKQGTTRIFGTIMSRSPFVVRDLAGHYYYVTNPSAAVGNFVFSVLYVKKSGNYKRTFVYSKGYVNCQVVTAKKMNLSYEKNNKKCKQKRSKCQKTLKNKPMFSWGKEIYAKGTTNEPEYYWKYQKAYPGKIKWKSNRPSVAKVNKNGYITAKKIGTAIITAQSTLNGKKSKLKVQVKNPYIKFNKSVYNFSYTSEKKRTEKIKYDGLTKTGEYDVSISDESIVSYAFDNEKGAVELTTTGKAGQTKITVKSKDGAVASCTVNVSINKAQNTTDDDWYDDWDDEDYVLY